MPAQLTSMSSLSLFAPELVLSGAMAVLLVVDLLLRESPSKRRVLGVLAIGGLLLAGLALRPVACEAPTTFFSGMIALDPMAVFFKGFFVLVGILGVLLALISAELETVRIGEYLALILSLVLGMSLLASASNLLMIYLSLELVSIPSYVLAGFRKGDRQGSEGALKYVIYGAVASGIMLFGMSLIYGLSGTLDVQDLRRVVFAAASNPAISAALLVGLMLTLAGFLYKIAAVPFHMWCPDVYQGAPTPFTAFLSVGPKAAGFAILVRFFHVAFVDRSGAGAAAGLPWPVIFGIISMSTMTLANLVALTQTNVKRLLAWSSVAHAGYILMGFSLANSQGVHAILLYLILYLVMNLGAFLAVMAVRDATGSEDLSAYRGLSSRSPAVAISMAVFLFSLTGLPPLAGFIGKFYIFAAVLNEGGLFYYALALVGVVNSVVSLYYYALVVRAMFLESAPAQSPRLAVSPAYVALLFTLVIPTVVLGIYWQPLSELASASLGLYIGR